MGQLVTYNAAGIHLKLQAPVSYKQFFSVVLQRSFSKFTCDTIKEDKYGSVRDAMKSKTHKKL
jgi:hypothetical protein